MKIGDKLSGVITGIKPYGAFVSLENGTTGLIHISEIKTGYIDNIYNTLKVNQEVLVQVMDYDEFTQKASLSLRTLEEEKHKIPHRHRFSNSRYKIGFKPLAEAMPVWVEEGMAFLKAEKED
ncbi:S1 RNA-binding domain-containing protein [Streptococcus dentiloxodontae]